MNNNNLLLQKKSFFLELWLKTKDGDKQAFMQLSDAHYNTLFRYASNFTKDKELIKDTIQDLLLSLWEKRQFIQIEVVTIYLIKSLRNRILNSLRKMEYSGSHTSLSDANDIPDEYLVEVSIITSELAINKEQKIQSAIDALPKRQQEAVFLKYYKGFDNEKISEIMSINKQSVANFLHKALINLKLNLAVH